ncbi:MAG TPA: hypothetical protein VIY69_05415, partial [Candidatus Acidoferrales bacterium]
MQFRKIAWSVAFLGMGLFAATTPQLGANELNPVYVAVNAQTTPNSPNTPTSPNGQNPSGPTNPTGPNNP